MVFRSFILQTGIITQTKNLKVVHAGKLIQSALHEKEKTVTWFAHQMCCTRTNVYKIFNKPNLDIEIIWRASCILEYDLFKKLSEELQKESSITETASAETILMQEATEETILMQDTTAETPLMQDATTDFTQHNPAEIAENTTTEASTNKETIDKSSNAPTIK